MSFCMKSRGRKTVEVFPACRSPARRGACRQSAGRRRTGHCSEPRSRRTLMPASRARSSVMSRLGHLVGRHGIEQEHRVDALQRLAHRGDVGPVALHRLDARRVPCTCLSRTRAADGSALVGEALHDLRTMVPVLPVTRRVMVFSCVIEVLGCSVTADRPRLRRRRRTIDHRPSRDGGCWGRSMYSV